MKIYELYESKKTGFRLRLQHLGLLSYHAAVLFVVECSLCRRLQVFDDFELEPHQECSYDSLSVYDGENTDSSSLGIFCGARAPHPLLSSNNKMYLVFKSDASVSRKGFKARHSTGNGDTQNSFNYRYVKALRTWESATRNFENPLHIPTKWAWQPKPCFNSIGQRIYRLMLDSIDLTVSE